MTSSSSAGSTTPASALSSNAPRDVLFFGDSLTWGMAHKYTGRYDVSWPRMLERRLNERGFNMVESALCSRTTTLDDPCQNDWLVGGEPHFFNGLAHFTAEFLSHECRAVVILLGTNDLKVGIRARRLDANAIANACAKIGLQARQAHNSMTRLKEHPFTVVCVSPPVVRLNQHSRELGYDETSVKISQEFPQAYRKMCKDNGFEFVHVKDIDMEESVDGVHVTLEGSKEIAEAVWETLTRVLEKRTPIPSFAPVDPTPEESAPPSSTRRFPSSMVNSGNPKDDDDSDSSSSGETRNASTSANQKSSSTSKVEGSQAAGNNKSSSSSSKGKSSGATGASGTKATAESASSRPAERTSKRARGGLDNSSQSDEDGEDQEDKDGQKSKGKDQVKDFVWNRCKECGKWRMTSAKSTRKTHWTCKDEFWSDKLEEWKVGCGWSADPWRDLGTGPIRSNDSNSMQTNTSNAYLAASIVPSVRVPISLHSVQTTAAATRSSGLTGDDILIPPPPSVDLKTGQVRTGVYNLKPVENDRLSTKLPSPQLSAKATINTNRSSSAPSDGASRIDEEARSESGHSSPEPSGFASDATPTSTGEGGTEADVSGMSDDVVAGDSSRQPGQKEGQKEGAALNGDTFVQGIDYLRSVASSGDAKMPRGRGRPPGSTNKIKQPLPRGRPPGSLNRPKPGSVPVAAPALRPIIISNGGIPVNVATVPGATPAPRQAVMQPSTTATYSMQIASTPQPIIQTSLASSATGLTSAQHHELVRLQLVPFIERICTSLPSSFQKAISQLVSVIGNDASAPTTQYQAYSELRQMFTSYPHIVRDLDTIIQSHPVLASCVVSPQTIAVPQQQFVYWQADPSQSQMAAAIYQAQPQYQTQYIQAYPQSQTIHPAQFQGILQPQQFISQQQMHISPQRRI